MTARLGAMLAATLLLQAEAIAESMPPLWSAGDGGPFAAGHTVIRAIDPDGSFDGFEAGRPMRLQVWYPAEAGSGRAMTFADYVEVELGPESFQAYDQLIAARDASTGVRQFGTDDAPALYEQLLATPVQARYGATAAPGRFPVMVFITGRNDYQAESTALWEGLARSGVVVIVTPQIARGIEDHAFSFTADDLRLQAEDARFALETVAGLEFADPDRRIYAGHSSGAIVAAMLVAADSDALGWLSFEGSVSTDDGAEMLDQLGIDPAVITAPGLVLNALAAPPRNHVFVDRIPAPVTTIGLPGGTHFDFQNWPLFAELTGVDDPRGVAFRPTARGAEVYRAAAAGSIAFIAALIERHPRPDDAALAAIRDVTDDIVTVEQD